MKKANSDFIIKDRVYDIGKDIDGKMKTTADLHPVILSIVLEIDRVCRKNNIPYALGFGSALGINNYAGFIPWDDDADIAIDYFDIPRLIDAFKKDLGDNFTFDCYETDERYNVLVPTMKVKRKDTYLKEKNWFTLPDRIHSCDGFFVDIVAFIGMINDEEHIKFLKRSKRRMLPYVICDAIFRIDPKRLKRKIKAEEKEAAIKYKDAPYVCQTPIIPWQPAAGNLLPRDVIFPFREYDFEGHKLFSFNKVEQFCILHYGPRSVKYFDGEKYVDRQPEKYRKVGHINAFSLDRPKIK
ncbi:MAG: LicD family protein [Erysipelotrichaceae bacterium]|jgi:lipopolysaccharide cholinephosphotransferase|nr:LicD family protein [Erysipelotrichaceae bacterium]